MWKFAEHMAPKSEVPDLLAVDRRQVEDFILHLQSADYAPNTVLRHFRGLAALFSWLASEDLIDRSPMEKLRAPAVELELPPVMSVDAVVSGKTGTRVVSTGVKTTQAMWRYQMARQRLVQREEPWLWLSVRGGKRLLGNGIYQVLRRRAWEAGLEDRVFVHPFRHTSTHLALGG